MSFIDYNDPSTDHHLVEVHEASFPEGAHLFLTRRNAKILRTVEPSYKLHIPRRSHHEHHNRHHHHHQQQQDLLDINTMIMTNRVKRDNSQIRPTITGCCDNDIQCMFLLCTIRH